jgi:hypothetical protein
MKDAALKFTVMLKYCKRPSDNAPRPGAFRERKSRQMTGTGGAPPSGELTDHRKLNVFTDIREAEQWLGLAPEISRDSV